MTPQPTRPQVLVTGAAGFVGSHLVDALLLQDWTVVGFDNLTTGTLENLANARLQETFTLIEGDICDPKAVAKACEGCAIVFHLAAVTKVAESLRQPHKYQEINVTGTHHVLTGAVQAKVQRIVFASSAAVYGPPETVPIPEDSATEPLSPYGASKLEGEQLCQTIAAQHNLIIPQLRLFNIYGPRQHAANQAGVVSIFMDRAHKGLPLTIFGDGNQTRDFIYIEDVIEAFLRTATRQSVSTGPMNVGTGIPVSLRELAEAVQHQVPTCSTEIQFAPPRPGDIYHSVAQITRMQHQLDFTPTFTLHDGLHHYYQQIFASIEDTI
ncbi:MAG: NAD-dependent epimerase/dehydratase family protein [Promethearchaeota archaeon]